MSTVKQLTADELPRLQEIGLAFTREVGHPDFNLDSFARVWSAVIANNLGTINYVEKDGEIVGILGASFLPDPFSGLPFGYEQFWYVRADNRQSRVGIDLFATFEKEAKARGCKRVLMVHLSTSKEDVLSKFYARKGYVPGESIYWKNL